MSHIKWTIYLDILSVNNTITKPNGKKNLYAKFSTEHEKYFSYTKRGYLNQW